MNLSIWKCPLINKKSVAVSSSRENRSLRFKRSSALLVAAFFFCAAGTLAADAELLKNGGFDPAGASVENGGVPAAGGKNASWSIYLEKRFGGEIAVTLDPAVGHLAPGAFRMIPGTRINASATVHQSLPVVAGQTYELKGWVMGRNLAGASLKAGIQAEFRQADGKFIGKEVLTILDEKTPAGEWRSGTFRVKTPEGAGGLTFAAWGEFKSYPENAVSPEIYFDDFSLTGGEREEYGASLPGGEGLGLWWCDNMRKIMRDQPVPKAAAAEVTVEAARNEFEPFQICLRPKAELRGVRFETLGAPQGVTLEFFREEYVPVLKPMDYLGEKADYPDPLVPVEGALTLAAGQNHPFWIDLKVGGNTPAGTYEFKIKISRDSGEPVNIPVRLKVYPFSLPQSTTVRTAFGVDVWPKWHGDLNTEQLKTVWKKYLSALTSHRLSPFITFTYGAFPWKPKVLSADPATGVVTCDFSAFDEIMGFLFDENHSNSFSLQLQPTPELLAMGKERNWDAAQTAKVKLAYQRALVAHVQEKGWLEKCCLYAYDEPTPDHYAQLVADLQRVKTEVPGLRRLVTFNNSMAPNGQFQNQVDIWVPGITKLDLWEAAQARRRGDQVWFYVCLGPLAPYPNLFIDHPSTSHRVLPWMVAQFNLDGFLYWNTTWSKFTNPWKEAMTRDEKPNEFVKINTYANGDGLLLYPPVKEPATAPVLAGPLPSIRLKMMREGLEDTEYLTLLRQRSKGEEALRLGGNLVHGTNAFELNPAHYQQVRRELAEAIVQAGNVPEAKAQEKAADVAEAPKIDLTAYRESTGTVVPSPPLINGQFDQGDKGWNLQAPFRVEAQGGLNQTGALFCERTETSSKVFFAVQEVPLLENTTYRLSAQIKTKNCQGTYPSWNAATLAVYYYKDGKFVGGGGTPTSKEMEKPLAGTGDWTRREVMFTVPAGITSGKIQLFMTEGGSGKIWFDDIAITPETLPPTAFLVRPTADRFLPTDGSFTIRWDNLALQKESPSISAWVRILADGKVVKNGIFPLQGSLTMGQIGNLPEGNFTLEATLLDSQEKQILHRQSFSVTCRAATAGGPHSVRIDNRGRTFVGDKPFMPIGLFTCQFDPQMLDRIARSPFNTLLPYTSLIMEYPPEAVLGSGAPRPAVGPGYLPGVRAAMDACHERGLKFIYCIDSWPKTVAERELTPNEGGEKENKKLMDLSATLVDGLKDHPALLAWYTADEPRPAVAPGLARFNHWLRQRDPWHPSYGVYMHFSDLGKFTASADIMGVDPYPIMDRRETMSLVDTAMRGAQSAIGTVPGQGLPLWGTVQAHNVGLYTPGARENKAILKGTNRLTPTEGDMRAMALRMAIGGARGFIFFCYPDLLSPSVASEFEQRWADHCRVGELLRELQPFLYSDEKARALTVKTLKGEVNAAAYQTADGKIRVLITGSGPGESEAEITVAGTDKLVSRFGNSEALGGGTYRFKGTNICSDVLAGD